MKDKELIKQEIEKRIKEGSSKNDISEGALALESLLDFIDSLPEEPFDYTNVNIIPKDFGELPQTIEQAAVQAHIELEECNGLSFVNTFFKGAEWHENKMKEALQTEYEKGRFDMREEMMKDAVECDVIKNGNKSDCLVWKDDTAFKRIISKLNNGDKVKIIVIKEEQQ